MFADMLAAAGRSLARFLNQPIKRYEPFSVTDVERLEALLEPADVLLVEGNARISTAIKYLTQSTWSHAALCVGKRVPGALGVDGKALVEADVRRGVIAVPVRKYAGLNTRVCRAVGLEDLERQQVCDFVIARIGNQYDLRNIIDLARFLLPVPPVPVYYRRRMLALGSGDPTRAICSSLIAQAFQSIRYPILPIVEREANRRGYGYREILHIRHHSLFAPRDFDVSPYFRVIKPTVEADFDFKNLIWADQPAPGSEPSG